MHSEIKKFWKDQGNYITVDILQDDLWKFYWAAVNIENEGDYRYVGWSDYVPSGTKTTKCIHYEFDGKTYSEIEMLKIIKLKAFI